MKKIALFTLIGVMVNFMSCDNDVTVPQIVKDAFATEFPKATGVEWEKESDTEWEAEFTLNGKEHSSNFMQDGTWSETEYEVATTEIPQVVLDVLNTNFEGYEIEESELSITADGEVYEFEIEKGKTKMEVIIDTEGIIIKKEQLKEDEADEDDD